MSLVPSRLREAAWRERRGFALQLSPTESALLIRTPDGERLLGTVAITAPDYHQQLQALIHDTHLRRRTLTVRLPPDLGLSRIIDLPLAALDDLRQLLEFEMDRLTPFRLDEVHYAYRVLGTDRQAGRVSIELHVAPRPEVARVLQITRHLGLAATHIQLATETSENYRPLNLYSEKQCNVTRETRLNLMLATLALTLAAAGFVIPLERQLATAAELKGKIAVAQVEADESLALQKHLDQLYNRVRFLEKLKSGRVTATEILAELTRLLPDQAHLLQIELRDGTVQLYGIAADAGNLIVLLEKSRILAKPQFSAPITKDPQSGLDHFRISIELVNRAGD